MANILKEFQPEVWQYQIGGYQVCDKWLKDRKGQSYHWMIYGIIANSLLQFRKQ